MLGSFVRCVVALPSVQYLFLVCSIFPECTSVAILAQAWLRFTLSLAWPGGVHAHLWAQTSRLLRLHHLRLVRFSSPLLGGDVVYSANEHRARHIGIGIVTLKRLKAKKGACI